MGRDGVVNHGLHSICVQVLLQLFALLTENGEDMIHIIAVGGMGNGDAVVCRLCLIDMRNLLSS